MQRAKRVSILAGAAATVVTVMLAPVDAAAATGDWINLAGGTYNWTDAGNWDGGAVPNAQSAVANLSVPMTGNLLINVPTDVTVGVLGLGGTAGAATTDVGNANAGAGHLLIDNGTVAATLTSGGVAGSLNRVTAGTILRGNLSFVAASTRDVTFAGNLQLDAGNRTITNNAAGPVLKLGASPAGEIRLYDFTAPATGRTLSLSGVANSVTEINGTLVRGAGDVGNLSFDAGSGMSFATFIFNAPQPFSGGLQRGTYVANDNLAFGPGTLTAAGSGTLTQTGGFTTGNGNQATWSGMISSTKPGGVTLPIVIQMGNSNAFVGNENIVLSGAISQANNRAMGNALVPGRTLTLTPDPVTNPTGVSIGISYAVANGNRTWIVEGSGTTIINGKVINNLTDDSTIIGNFEKRGSGRTELNNGGSTIRGEVRARGGNLVFGAANAWGTPTGINVQTNGGIWYTPGVGAAGWDDGANSLVAKILPTSAGFFAVPASAAGSSFDFSTGNLNLNAKSVGIGADGDVTFTGTVTPDATVGYNWGGNTGTLTLGANASAGARPVTYKNGGTVVLTGTQSYTGITTIQGDNMVTSQAGILTKNLHSTNTNNVFTSTVLSISQLSNAGAASSLGASLGEAANLVINGGTLRYTGSSQSTDRLFTTGSSGATLDASGSGAVTFGSAGGDNVTNGNTLTLTGSNTGDNRLASNLPGTVAVTKSGAGKWVLGGANTYTGATSVSNGILVLGQSQTTTSSVTVSDATLQLADGGGSNRVLKTGVVTVSGGGRVDIRDNKLITTTGPGMATGGVYDGVQGLVQSAYNFGAWDGNGLTTSMPDALAGLTTIGVATGEQIRGLGATDTDTFAGQTITGASTVAMYTYAGDANLDGTIDGGDYGIIDNFVQVPGAFGYANGDFNYDGVIDGGDYGIIDNNIQAQGAPFPTSGVSAPIASEPIGGVQAVPEPAAAVSAILAAAFGARRRRSRTVTAGEV